MTRPESRTQQQGRLYGRPRERGAGPLMRRAATTLMRLAGSTSLGLASLLVAVFVVAGALGAHMLASHATELFTRQIVETLSAEAAGLRDLDRVAGLGAVRSALEQRVELAVTRSQRSPLYLLSDERGRLLLANFAAETEAVLGSAAGAVFSYQEPGGAGKATSARWAVGVPVPLASGARLLVARDIEDVRRFSSRLRIGVIAALLTLAMAGLALGAASGRRVLSRIEAVTEAADRILTGDLSQRIEITAAGDEIDNLAERLNLMLDRIEQLLRGMREISDNIAHDLKTPLSRLRNRAEAALRDTAGESAYRRGLERTIEAADDIITTFNALLLIARLEAGAVPESFTTFDAAALVRDVAELYAPAVEEANARLAVNAPGEAAMVGNRHLIGQAIANLIDNAIKHGHGDTQPADPSAAAASRIALSVDTRAGEVVFRVADTGPGIAAEDRVRVLGRFVRLDRSRTAPGTGLGLSLVAAVASLHHGRLTLDDGRPGLVVEMAVPQAPPASDGQQSQSRTLSQRLPQPQNIP